MLLSDLAKALDLVRALKVCMCIIGHHHIGLAYWDVTFVVGISALYYRFEMGTSSSRLRIYSFHTVTINSV